MKKLLTISSILLGLFLFTGIASASTTDLLQPASTITYNEDLTVDGTGRFNSIYIGETGVGGVTFFNGTIINIGEHDPVTFGDDVRIDGQIWGGPNKGNASDQGLKIADTLLPALTNLNDIGSSDLRWKTLYATSGDFTEGLTVQGGEVWTSENDGLGSGLDADKLDGHSTGYFAKNSHSHDGDYLKLSGGVLTGSLTAPSYNYSSAQTRIWSIHPYALMPQSKASDYNKDGQELKLADMRYVAPVHLPNGATIKKVNLNFYDNDTGDVITYRLVAVDDSDTPVEVILGSFNSSVSTSVQTAEITINHLVNNDQNTYLLDVEFSGSPSANLRVRNTEIEYTVMNPKP